MAKKKPVKKNQSSQVKRVTVPRKAEVPVTQKMLHLVRDQLQERMLGTEHRLRAEIESSAGSLRQELHSTRESLRQEFHSTTESLRQELHSTTESLRQELHSTRDSLHKDMSEIKVNLETMSADVHDIRGEIHRLGGLMEEQNARNAVVMDGLRNLFGRQERIEDRMDGFEADMSSWVAASLKKPNGN